MVLMLSLFLLSTLFSDLICMTQPASRFECSATSQCSHREFTCDPHRDCIIICNGANACNEAIFNCPASVHTCDIICSASNDTDTSAVFGCAYVTIDASQSNAGSLTINTTHNSQIMEGAMIKCPPNGPCDIHCHGNKACYRTQIVSHPQTTSLSVVASGDHVLKDSRIICPNEDCSILVSGDYLNMLSCIHIYSEHSFIGIHMKCDYSTHIHTNCYDTHCYPQMECNPDHSGSCEMRLVGNSNTDWQCVSPSVQTNDCSVATLPYISPSLSPHSLSPSAPTAYPKLLQTTDTSSSSTETLVSHTMDTKLYTTHPGVKDVELTLRVDSNHDPKLMTTFISSARSKDNIGNINSDFFDATVAFLSANILAVILSLVGSIFCCFCVLMVCYCHCKLRRKKRTKREYKSPTSANALNYDTYDGEFGTTQHTNRTKDAMDDTDVSDSFGFNDDGDAYGAIMTDNPYQKLKLQQVPSGSIALEFDMRESISIGLEHNNKYGAPQIISTCHQNVNDCKIDGNVNALCGLSEGEEDINPENKRERDSLLFASDDDNGSLEEMYVDKYHTTVRYIAKDCEDDTQDDVSNGLGLQYSASAQPEGNAQTQRRISLDGTQREKQIFVGSLPKLPDTPSTIAHECDTEHFAHKNLNIITETAIDTGGVFRSREMNQYPSLPTEVISILDDRVLTH